jgi:hypothetical protein
MNLADFAKRAEEIIAMADQVIPTFRVTAHGIHYDSEDYSTFRAAGLSFLSTTFGESHSYFREFESRTSRPYRESAEGGRGILVAARDEVRGGWAVTARGIVSAEIFADFLEMAQYLLSEKYKDAAAVMVGSTLEEHLRQLARKHAVPIDFVDFKGRTVPKKADVLNADLVKASIYGILQQKTITAWLDLRNKAAHGEYGEYKQENVELMYQGVSQFMTQYPA